MEDLLQWYMHSFNFTEAEYNLLKKERVNEYIEVNDAEYLQLTQEYFNLIPFSNLNTSDYFITFDECGSDFINKVFEDEVDDETLVISTYYEHPSVQKWLNKVKNKILLDSNNDLRTFKIIPLIQEAKKYKKVFVYIIGTQISTGEITPQQFFEKLREAFIKNNIKYKLFLDDVHGMFLMPRDYSIFDYILYTAHAIIPAYDMGLLISKHDKYGKKAYNWGKDYLKRLSLFLQHKDKINLFKKVLTEYLNDLFINTSIFRYYTHTVDHIFAVETKNLYFTEEEYNILDSYNICVCEHKAMYGFIRIRFQNFIDQPVEKSIEGLNILRKILHKKMMLYQLKEGL